MTYYDELTTVRQVRFLQLNSTSTSDDSLLLSMIRQASHDIEFETHRKFSPIIDTRYYDAPNHGPLLLDDDLLELTTLSNGDGTAFGASEYKTYPLNTTPINRIVILGSSPAQWSRDDSGNAEGAINLAGVWGYHPDYISAWLDTTAVLGSNISTSATTLTCATGLVFAGDLIKVDDEYMHISSVVVSTSDTATVVRSVNGSTAAVHSTSAIINRWNVYDSIANIAVAAAVGYYNLRTNPTRDTIQLDNGLFVTPKDVKAFIRAQVQELGIIRTGFA